MYILSVHNQISFKTKVSERGFTPKQRKKVIYGREKHTEIGEVN